MQTNGRPTPRLEHTPRPRRLAPGQAAEALLRGSGYLALRAVTCVVRDEVAHLHGHLPTYYLKQMAQALVSGVEGVGSVVNHIRVLTSPSRMPEGKRRVTTRAAETY